LGWVGKMGVGLAGTVPPVRKIVRAAIGRQI
jgi:hypothetical protein